MLRSLFARGRRKRESPPIPLENTIQDARVGDVVVLTGFALEYDDCYFVVENVHRYAGGGIIWHEVVAADANNRLWLEWSEDGDGLHVTATDNRRPVGLDSLGLTEADLLDMDASRSIDRSINVNGLSYMYRNSFEAFYFRDSRPNEGEGFYLWEFLAEDESRVLSITKFEEQPFEAHFADIIPSENVLLYPGARPERRSR